MVPLLTLAPRHRRIMKAKIRIGLLITSGDVKTEIARVYRQARRGQLDTSEGTNLVYMLRVLLTAIETSDVEQRLDALERVETGPRKLAA